MTHLIFFLVFRTIASNIVEVENKRLNIECQRLAIENHRLNIEKQRFEHEKQLGNELLALFKTLVNSNTTAVVVPTEPEDIDTNVSINTETK